MNNEVKEWKEKMIKKRWYKVWEKDRKKKVSCMRQERIERMKTCFRTENWKEKWFRDKTGELNSL